MKTRLIFLWVFTLTACSLLAQIPSFKHLEVADGLSNNSVYAILKDEDGFMWFGTASGLNRYDGYNFKIYRHLAEDSTSISDNYVTGLTEGPNHLLWVQLGTRYVLFDKSKDRFINNLKGFMQEIGSQKTTPSFVHVDSSKNTWICVAGEGIYRYSQDKRTTFQSFKTLGLPDTGINAIAECNKGILLLYDTGKIACLNPQNMKRVWIKKEIEKELHGKKSRFSLFIDKEGCAWICCVDGLWAYNISTDKWLNDLVKPWRNQVDFVHTLSQDQQGRIWIGKDYNGIDILDKKTGKVIHVVNNPQNLRSVSHNTIYTLYADRNGMMWVGTYKKGISVYEESMFKFHMYEIGDITCMEETDDSHVWLGTNDKGILLWNHATSQVEKSYPLDCPVVSLKQSSDGRLWIGTFNGGLYSLKNNHLTHYTTSNGLLNHSIWALEAENSRLWIGFLEGGLQYLDLQENMLHTYPQIDRFVSSLDVTKDHELIVGMYGGIAFIDLSHLSQCQKIERKDPEWNEVNQVYCDSRNLVWIATRGNLKVYDKKSHRLKVFSNVTGVPGEIISGINEDHNHDLWITSTRRMVHLKVAKNHDGSYTFDTQIYNEKDGLQNCDFNLRSIKTLHDGTIVAGGLYGLNTFNPDEMHYNKLLPNVLFSAFYLFGQEVKAGQKYHGRLILSANLNQSRKVELNHDQNILTIEFATDNFNLPEKTTYKYYLDGLGNQWLTLPVGVNRVTLTNLNPGTYTLHVKAINSDGYEGTSTALLTIVVHPPFWLTWWAYLCYALLVLFLLYIAHKLLLKREHEKFRIQQIEQEAAKNEEINQMKFRFFTNISHELRTPLTLIIAPLEKLLAHTKDDAQKSTLKLMYRNAQSLLMLVNQLLDFRKGEISGHQLSLSEGDIVTFVRGVCQAFLSMAGKKHIQFSFFPGMENFPMAFDTDKIGKVVMNLLSNAFKYTPEGGRVTVILEHMEGEEESIELKVSDTGIGIPDADKSHIFERFYQAKHKGAEDATGSGIGLSLVQDFVQLHGGTVDVFDNIGTGTVFVVHLPVKHVDTVTVPPQPSVPAPDSVEIPIPDIPSTERSSFPLLLVVDDNEDFLQFMRSSLELQYQVATASNGEEAWHKIQEKQPDLVISDVMMPKMDGNALCRMIKSNQQTTHIPVILLTARQAMESEVEGLETGADDYVTKPFHLTILLLRIQRLIALTHSSHEAARQTINPSPSEIAITSLDEQLIEKAIKYVEENIARSELSVEELSRELGMSRVHLYKKLLQITGKTPIEFIRIIRLKRAAQLLRKSQLHVSEVAYAVGFNNPKYFSRYFKEEFGVLPSVYQEKGMR